MGILQGCIFFTTSTKMPQGPKIFCLALIVDMLYFFSPQPHIFLGISSNLYTYVKLYTFSSHLLKLTKSVQWLTHVAEITLVDKKSKKNCLTAKFWQKMPQCSLANVWRIYTAGILRVGSGWIGISWCINEIWIKLIFCVEFVFNMTFFSYLHMFRVAAVMRVLRLILRPVLTASDLRAREVLTESPPLRRLRRAWCLTPPLRRLRCASWRT